MAAGQAAGGRRRGVFEVDEAVVLAELEQAWRVFSDAFDAVVIGILPFAAAGSWPGSSQRRCKQRPRRCGRSPASSARA